MPFSKEKNRRIYFTAFVISFLLIVGSIYLHLRQKTHLGRMSFNLDRDRIKPTSGVELETTTVINEYDSEILNAYQYSAEENDIEEELSADNNNDDIINSGQFDTDDDIDDNDEDDDINEDEIIDEDNNANIDADIADSSESDEIVDNDSDFCLRCLCMTVNECRPTYCSSENPCGLYKISKLYWIDGGKATIAGGSIDNEDQDYLTCVNDATCSANTIRQYYNRYKRDCNKDGKFDCVDLIMLHFLGPTGCLTQNLSNIHTSRMNRCFKESPLNYSFSEEY